MIIGIPKEIKAQEGRVSATPAIVAQLVKSGNEVLVETQAGVFSGYEDEEYSVVGAQILDIAEEVWNRAELIYKVKEPLPEEYKYFREGLMIYTYLHLASEEELTQALLDNKVTGIAYETVQVDRTTPLLKPMSEVAGRMAVLEGAYHLKRNTGGRGTMLGGVPGVLPANVVVVGGGVVGTAAIRIATGMGARVTVVDNNLDRLAELVDIFGNDIETLYSTELNLAMVVQEADLVISTVLIPGEKAPQLITEDMVKTMPKGSVIVDVAIDQGGSTNITAEHGPTTLAEPTFTKHGVVHYAVANIPGAVPRMSTEALSNATSVYLFEITRRGLKGAIERRPELEGAFNTVAGHITNSHVAKALNLELRDPKELL